MSTITAWATHTESGFNVRLKEQDAHEFPARYDAAYDSHRTVRIDIFSKNEAKPRRRGVRPGAPYDFKGQGETVRYMQFEPIQNLEKFGIVEVEIAQLESGNWRVQLPDPLPPMRSVKGSSHKMHPTPTPNPDPIPFTQGCEAEGTPTLGVYEVGEPIREVFNYQPRITIREAVERVNAFLAETPGAEPEIIGHTVPRLRITVAEVYE